MDVVFEEVNVVGVTVALLEVGFLFPIVFGFDKNPAGLVFDAQFLEQCLVLVASHQFFGFGEKPHVVMILEERLKLLGAEVDHAWCAIKRFFGTGSERPKEGKAV